jgi:hypothetical protein
MADTYGAIELPVLAPTDGPDPNVAALSAVSDPGLDTMLAFLKAVVNAELSDAWHKRAPAQDPIGFVFPYNPEDAGGGFFNDRKGGALYGYRKPNVAGYDYTDGFRVTEDAWTFLWVPPEQPQARSGPYKPIINGLAKVVDEAVYLTRHPAYQKPLDQDPKALDVAALPSSILLTKATLTSQYTYAGAGLDGSIGPAVIGPARGITIALGGTAGSFTVGSTITLSGLDVLGFAQSEIFVILTGAETFASANGYTAVTSVAVDAQTGTAGTITVGTGAFVGRGTLLLPALGAMRVWPLKQAAWRYLKIQREGAKPLAYPAIEFSYVVREQRVRNISDDADASLTASLLRSDGSVIESFIP